MRVFRLTSEQEREFEKMENKLGIDRVYLVEHMVCSFVSHLQELGEYSIEGMKYELFLTDKVPTS